MTDVKTATDEQIIRIWYLNTNSIPVIIGTQGMHEKYTDLSGTQKTVLMYSEKGFQ